MSQPPRHLTPEERIEWLDKKRREDRRINLIVVAIMLGIGFLIIGATLLHAELVYDDWRCAFAECRIIKTEKQ